MTLPCRSATSHSTAGVAQSVRAPDCGSGCRGFESHHSPHHRKSGAGVSASPGPPARTGSETAAQRTPDTQSHEERPAGPRATQPPLPPPPPSPLGSHPGSVLAEPAVSVLQIARAPSGLLNRHGRRPAGSGGKRIGLIGAAVISRRPLRRGSGRHGSLRTDRADNGANGDGQRYASQKYLIRGPSDKLVRMLRTGALRPTFACGAARNQT